MAQSISTGTFGVAKWVVSPDPTQGSHTTIQSAINSASAGDTIFIRDGTYTETITGKAGITLTALSGDQFSGNVTIIMIGTYAGTGIFTISNCTLQTNGAPILTVSGANASTVFLDNCFINCTDANFLSFTNSNAASFVNLYQCDGDLLKTGITYHTSSSPGVIFYNYCELSNSGNSTTASTNSAGTVQPSFSFFTFPFSSSGSGTVNSQYSLFNCSNINQTALSINSSVASTHLHSFFGSGTASAVIVTSSPGINLSLCTVTSSNTNAITGTGSGVFQGVSYTGTSQTNNVTTQLSGTLKGSTFQTPSSGFLGETIRGYTASPGITLGGSTDNIVSISLTPGIWDVSGIVMFLAAAITGTIFIASIVTTSATNGVEGDNQVGTPYPPTINSNSSLSIPSYRISLTATTTVYLTAAAGVTVGTLQAFGRLSATRVG